MSGLIKRLYAIGTSGKAKGDFLKLKRIKMVFMF